MKFKALVFKSPYTKAVYLWNGFDIICVSDSQERPVGKIMNGFADVDFNLIYQLERDTFKKGDQDYIILNKI